MWIYAPSIQCLAGGHPFFFTVISSTTRLPRSSTYPEQQRRTIFLRVLGCAYSSRLSRKYLLVGLEGPEGLIDVFEERVPRQTTGYTFQLLNSLQNSFSGCASSKTPGVNQLNLACLQTKALVSFRVGRLVSCCIWVHSPYFILSCFQGRMLVGLTLAKFMSAGSRPLERLIC